MAYFLGIDGGGTRTTAWVSDDRNRILARAVAGPSNPLKVGFEAAQREILRAARMALRQARVAPGFSPARASAALKAGATRAAVSDRQAAPALLAVCVGLAGAGHPSVRHRLLPWLRRTLRARFHLLTSDAAIALRAAVGDSPGIIVIAGSGSIAYGQDEQGRVVRAGGWGVPFDDAGSGYDLGRRAVAAALRAFDGRGPHTQLLGKICRARHLPDITRVTLRQLSPQEIAAFFTLVPDAARRGDAVARELCERAGRDLADLVIALLKRLGWRRRIVPVVCAGGVFRSSLRIRQSFARHLRRHTPRARVLPLHHPPVEGALALARDLAKPSWRSR